MQNVYSRSGTFGRGNKATSTCTGGLGVGHQYMYWWPRAGATVNIHIMVASGSRRGGGFAGLRQFLSNRMRNRRQQHLQYSMLMRVSAQGVAPRLARVLLLLVSVFRSCVASASLPWNMSAASAPSALAPWYWWPRFRLLELNCPFNEKRAMRREEMWRREFDEWCEMRESDERRAMDREDVNAQEPVTPRSLKKRRCEKATPEKTTQANSDDTESEDSLADMLE